MEQKHTPRHFLKTNGLIRNDDTETINANVLAVIHSMEGYVQSKNSELLQQVAELTKENERKDEECRKAVHIMNEHRHNDLIEKDKEIKALTEQVENLTKHLQIEIKANETLRREHKKQELEKIEFVGLLKDYEQWEADLISDDRLWWPNREKDVLRGEIYNKMLELQEKRNALLKL